MKPNLKTKVMILLALGIVFGLSPIISNGLIFDTGKSDESNFDNKNLKISAVSGKIHIDNNWTAAKAAGICMGDGTYSDPYIIEDLEIDGGGLGSCILIENSDVYFKIENCTVYGSEQSHSYAGIRLLNVKNSLLIRNYCPSNYHGISLWTSSNNTISENNVIYNKYFGVFLSGSYDNTISGNTVNSNFESGISLFGSYDNTISGNTVNNTYKGILLRNSDNNIISFNTITHSDFGIYLFESNSNEISNNLFSDNYKDNVNETESFILYILNIIIISTVIITIVVTGILIIKRRKSKDEVAKFYRLKGQEKQLKDGVELNDKKTSDNYRKFKRKAKGEVARYHELKEQEKQLRDDLELLDKSDL